MFQKEYFIYWIIQFIELIDFFHDQVLKGHAES